MTNLTFSNQTMKKFTQHCLSAGLVPLVWFISWVTLGGLLAPNYSMAARHASELLSVGGVSALCMQIGVIGSGIAFIVFSIGLASMSHMRPSIGAMCYFLFGCSMISNGIWPLGSPMHGLYAVGLLTIVAPALAHLEIGHALRSRRAYLWTAFVSVSGILYLWLNLTGTDPQSHRGLTQRLFSSINSIWPFVVAVIILRDKKAVVERSVASCSKPTGGALRQP